MAPAATGIVTTRAALGTCRTTPNPFCHSKRAIRAQIYSCVSKGTDPPPVRPGTSGEHERGRITLSPTGLQPPGWELTFSSQHNQKEAFVSSPSSPVLFLPVSKPELILWQIFTSHD